MDDSNSCFISLDDMNELERIYDELGDKSSDQDFCKELVTRFRSESKGPFKTTASWEQVQKWFQIKHRESKDHGASSSDGLNLTVDRSDKSSPNPDRNPKPKGFQASDLDGLTFEARSMKDHAWHDVGMFLNYRFLSKDRVEVRVRYHGCGKEEDEWVNVDEEVRQSSIPLEASDCHKVKEGHLVLCYLVRSDYALYFDARVIKIQRRTHNNTNCTCIFTVRFCHDKSEEDVSWESLCCRPTQEESERDVFDPTLNPIENLWG